MPIHSAQVLTCTLTFPMESKSTSVFGAELVWSAFNASTAMSMNAFAVAASLSSVRRHLPQEVARSDMALIALLDGGSVVGSIPGEGRTPPPEPPGAAAAEEEAVVLPIDDSGVAGDDPIQLPRLLRSRLVGQAVTAPGGKGAENAPPIPS